MQLRATQSGQHKWGHKPLFAAGLLAILSMPAHAKDAMLPIRKDAAIKATQKAAVAPPAVTSQTQNGEIAKELTSGLKPGPPPRVNDASGDASKDPATTYVPGIRRMKPTVPPKPAALQRWLSRL